MKRAYLANGYLTQALAAKESTAYIDATTWAYLNGLLGSDYCYLLIYGAEIVKVLEVRPNNAIALQRGLEGTERKTWTAGQSMAYGLTESEIHDATTSTTLTITQLGGITVNGQQIGYYNVTIDALGGIEVDGDAVEGFAIRNLPTPVSCVCDSPETIPTNFNPWRDVDDLVTPRTTDDGSPRQYQ